MRQIQCKSGKYRASISNENLPDDAISSNSFRYDVGDICPGIPDATDELVTIGDQCELETAANTAP